MNDLPMSPLPPFGDDTDEALSALLDGELAAFATERDLTEAEARAQLEGWPGSETRLAELERARAALHAPVPELDDVTRRRLVHAATSATAPRATSTPTRTQRSWATIVAVAAAGLLVVVGLGVAISSSSSGRGGNNRSSSAGGTSAAGAPLRGDVGDLGDITSPAALRALLDRRASAESDAADSTTTAPAPAPEASGPTDSSKLVDPATCAQTLAGTGTVTFTGTGTYRGAPVTIFGITTGGRTIVFVVSSTDCTQVLTSISR
jgi:hypothetical protein